MNRLVVVLLSVLILLVAAHGILVWRAAEDAREAAERQECLQRSQTTAVIAVVAPALVAPADDDEARTARLEAIAALGEQAAMAADPRASAAIDAPLAVVWRVMLDTEAYGEWNPFVERVETAQPPAVGNPIVLHVRWTNGRGTRSPEVITAIEPPATAADGTTTALLSYEYAGLPSKLGLVRGTRHQRLTQAPGGLTTYETVEEFSGPLVPLAGPGRVAEGFRRHAEALKRRAESLAA